MAYLVGSADTTRFDTPSDYNSTANLNRIFTNGNTTQGITPNASGQGAIFNAYVNDWGSVTAAKYCVYESIGGGAYVFVGSVVFTPADGVGELSKDFDITIDVIRAYRTGLYTQNDANLSLWTDQSSGARNRHQTSQSGNYTSPIDPLPGGLFDSFEEEFYWAIQDNPVTPPSITSVDGNNIVIDGQQDVPVVVADFGNDLTAIDLMIAGAASGVTLTDLQGTGDNYTVDFPALSDVTIAADIPGVPFTSADFNIEVSATDGTDSAVLEIDRLPPADHYTVTTVGATAIRGTIFQGRAGGAPSDGSQATASDTAILLPDGTISSSQDSETGTLWDVDTGLIERWTITWINSTPISFAGTIPDRSATIDALFSLSVAGNFSTELTPITYSLQAGTLPTGLSLNTSTGVISGTPTVLQAQAGIVIRGTDTGLNTADTNAFSINIVEAAQSGGIRLKIQSPNGIRAENGIRGKTNG